MKIIKNILGVITVSAVLSLSGINTAEFWERRAKDKKGLEEFKEWWGGANGISRILVRLHIINKEYKSVLDIPCGLCVDYEAFKRNYPDIQYLGIDITPTLVEKNVEKGIPVLIGNIQEIPCQDSSFDVVYARHILEHLDSYHMAIKEMVRVAKKEVIVVFFIKPTDLADDISSLLSLHGCHIYQNKYSKSQIEGFLKTIPKVKSFNWQEVKNKDECILHILV